MAANNTVVVTPTNEQGFMDFAGEGGTVSFVVDPAAPSGSGALRLTTNSSNEAFAQYTKETNTRLRNITQLSYYTKQNSGPEFCSSKFCVRC
jgi:hypothetical protein